MQRSYNNYSIGNNTTYDYYFIAYNTQTKGAPLGAFGIGLLLSADRLWDWYRSEYLACHTLPQTGESRCYRNEAAWIYALSDGQITVVPDSIDLIQAYGTYNVWASTHNAATREYFATMGSTVTPVPLTAVVVDGSTLSPADLTQQYEGFQTNVLGSFSRGTPPFGQITPHPLATSPPPTATATSPAH